MEAPEVAFTGHRPNKLGGYASDNPLKAAIQRALHQRLAALRPKRAWIGLALGFDQWAAEVCVARGIPFVACIPFVGQEEAWPQASRGAYYYLRGKAEYVLYFGPSYGELYFEIRDHFMVDRLRQPEDRLIACWNGTSGGTALTVAYAQKTLLPVQIDIMGPDQWT